MIIFIKMIELTLLGQSTNIQVRLLSLHITDSGLQRLELMEITNTAVALIEEELEDPPIELVAELPKKFDDVRKELIEEVPKELEAGSPGDVDLLKTDVDVVFLDVDDGGG